MEYCIKTIQVGHIMSAPPPYLCPHDVMYQVPDTMTKLANKGICTVQRVKTEFGL